MTEQLLTAAEVAELLSVPESWVREATRQDQIPHLHLGRYIRYQPTTLQEWLADATAKPGSGPIRPTKRP